MEKKKRKKKSMSSQIKELKKEIDRLRELLTKRWDVNYELERKLDKVRKVFPEKYFKVKFKIKSNSGHVVELEEIKESFSLNLAIEDIKLNKTHPNTFELVDVKVLN